MDITSDSEDSIIFIPYVKPPIPVLVVDDDEVINIDGDNKEEIAGPSNQKQGHFSCSTSSSSSTNSYPVKSTFDNTSRTQDVIENSSLQIQELSNYSTPENKKKAPGKSNNNNNNNNNRNEFYDIDRKGSYGPSTFPYTFTDTEKRTDLLYEKIVNVVRKQKLEKKLMLERVNQSKQACLEQVKNLTKSKTSTFDSNSSSSNTTSPQKNQKQSSMGSTPSSSKDTTPTTTSTTLAPSLNKKKSTTRTKRRRDDSGSLSAAELDHYNFLKTLNLTANIGLDENEMLALGRPQTKSPRKKRTKKSIDVVENNLIIINNQDQQPISESSLQCKINNNESNSVSKSPDLIVQKQGEEIQDIPLINPGPSTTTTSASKSTINLDNKNDLDDATVIQFVSIIDESIGKNNNKKKKKNVKSSSSSSSNSLINVSSSSLTIPSPKMSQPLTSVSKKHKSTNNKKVSEEIVIISSDSDDGNEDEDDEENHGIFTRQELDKLQSNIRLNISGGDGNKSFTNTPRTARNSQQQQQQASKPQEKRSAKKSFRYFQTSKTTQQCQNNDDDDEDEDSMAEKESLHDNSSCSSTSESRISAVATNNRTISKNRFIKNKLKELKRKSSDTTPTKLSKQQQKMPQSKRTKFDDDCVVNSENSNDSDVDSVSSSSSLLIRPMSYSNRQKKVDDLESTLNNDSLTDRLYPTTWTDSMKEFYGRVHNENLDVDDVLSKQKDYRGYWATPLDPDYSSNYRGQRRIKCDNCQQWGHVKSRCPEPVKLPSCLMCGEEMHTTPCFYSIDQRSSKLNRTTPSRCPNTSCLNCGKSGTLNRKKQGCTSRFVQSCEMCSTLSNHHGKTFKTCRNCNQHGHIASICPEDWRRFHSTTTPDYEMEKIPIPPNAVLQKAQYKSRQHQYCSNCGKKNHMYFNCGGTRDFNSYLPSTPYINNELPLCLLQSDLPNTPINNTMMTSSSITPNNFNSTTTPSSSCITPSISNDLQYKKTGTKSSTATETTFTTTNDEKQQSINETNNPKNKSQHRNSSCSNEIQTPKVLEKDSNNSSSSNTNINEATTLSSDKSQCPDFPHCTNVNEKGQTCHIIHLSKEEYQLIFKLNEQINVLTQLTTENQTCTVCLVEKSSSFHLYGNYDDLRDKIFQLLYKLKTGGVKQYVQTVLENDKIINKETEGKTQVLETQKVSSSSSINPEISSPVSSSSSVLQEKKDKEHSDNESDPVLFHKKTIINDNLNVEESIKETVSNNNNNIDNKPTSSIVDDSYIIQDESEIFIEPEIDIIMNTKITITNERALVTSSMEKTSNNNQVTALHEPDFQEINQDDAMISTSDKTTTMSPKSGDFEQIKPNSTTTTTTAGDEQQAVQEANINIGNQSSSSSPPSNVQNKNNTLNSKLKEVSTASSSSNSCEKNDSEFPEIIHIEDDDDEDDDEAEDAVIVQEVSRTTTTTTTNKSPHQTEGNHSKSPKRQKEKTTTTTTTTTNNNDRKSQEHVSPVATIKVNAAEWKQLLHMHSIEFLNSVRDEFNVQISAEKEKLSIFISNNKWATLLNAKFKIHQWLLSKTYNNNTTSNNNTDRRDQYPKNNNRFENRSRQSTKNEEISSSSAAAGSSSSRSFTITKNQDTRRESTTNRQRRFQHDPQNNRGNGRGNGNFRGFRGPRSFKNFNHRNQNGGF